MKYISDAWGALTALGRQYALPDRAATSLRNQASGFERDGMTSPEVALLRAQAAEHDERKEGYKKQAAKLVAGTAVAEYVEARKGLGDFAFIMLGAASPNIRLRDFRNPSCLHKHYGLHPKEEKNCPGWRKSYATNRLVEPIIRLGEGNGALRQVYDDRKAHTLETHPPMLEEGNGCAGCDAAYEKRRRTGKNGWDCANVGGVHWTDAHRHQDAIRYTSKKILTDLWRVEHDQPPRVGQVHLDSQQEDSDTEAAA